MSKVKIRKDLRKEFEFSTDDGMLIDNDKVYESRYNEDDNDQFQVYINGDWHNTEGIDFEFLN